MAGPLSHIRVLDLSRVLAGPWCGQNLADLGAEVIKVERPKKGDDSRAFGPPWLKDRKGNDTAESAYYAGANRGKKSITVDLSNPEGAALVKQLAARADVLIENYKVGDLARYGLGYKDMQALNPRLIYCSVTGFGQTGPYRDKPGYDFMAQGMGGLMSVTGERDSQPGGGPQRVGVPIIDIMTGMYASIAICAAIAGREKTGEGQFIDAAMVDVTTAINAHLALGYLMTGQVPQRQGNNNPITAPSEVFRAQDGYFSMSAANAGQFTGMLQVLGIEPALDQDPRFATGMARIKHRKALHEILEARTLSQPVRHWIDRLSPLNVPCAPIYDMQQLFDDPHVRHHGLAMTLPHASGVDVPVLRSPLHLSAAPVQHRAPPMLGQHTDEVQQSLLGKTAAQVAQLRADRVV